MIPINVSCEINQEPAVVTAFIDYATQKVVVPSEGNPASLDPEVFRASLLEFLGDQEEDRVRQVVTEVPPHAMPEFIQPDMPETHTGEVG